MNRKCIVFLVALACILIAGAVAAFASQKGPKPKSAAKLSDASEACVACHEATNPGIVARWKSSAHAKARVGCFECHRAEPGDADAFDHNGATIAVIITPRDCARCHGNEDLEFERSHHAKAGNILASLDNYLAETVEGARVPFNPHSPTPGRDAVAVVNGLASAQSGCQQCHGARVALKGTDGTPVTVEDLKPGPDGKPASAAAVARIAHDQDGKPIFLTSTWPNTGIGRLMPSGGSSTTRTNAHG